MNWNKRRNNNTIFFFLLIAAALVLGSLPQVRSYLKKFLQEKSVSLFEFIQGTDKNAPFGTGKDDFSIRLDQGNSYDTMQDEQPYWT
ncbi:MAG: hypothetical protein WB502_11140 [Thermoactinomyces sp.]